MNMPAIKNTHQSNLLSKFICIVLTGSQIVRWKVDITPCWLPGTAMIILHATSSLPECFYEIIPLTRFILHKSC